ncbi:hypothetical protein [Microvirga mediterraneensis]|uniref:Uncharacterized protein n=1 Tax=Microvirga mediterraneensis TaxID=2754695 RepID=A0A838BQ43_9HYPH|nr:hypothetical protein [Microvirga mediterraneensis]MBA1157042.1 hypothetical protein [Microvirga mediterraneensis]
MTADDPREILTESGLEAKAVYVLLARRDCASLVEQPPFVKYVDYDGVEHRHWFDLLLTRSDGSRVAFMVKPEKYAAKHGLRSLLAHIAPQLSTSFAHSVGLITEKTLGRALVHNATLIHECKRHPDADVDQRIREVAATLSGATTADCLIKAAGLEGDGFRAVVRAIADGTLETCSNGRINRAMWVRQAKQAGERP